MINLFRRYERENFISFLNYFLPDDFDSNIEEYEIINESSSFSKIYLLGKVPSLNNLPIFEIERKDIEKSRIKITKELFSIMEQYGLKQILTVTMSKIESHFRFSLITSELEWSSEKKVSRKFSNPRRQSFLLGVDQKKHTPTQQLIKSGKLKSINDLYARFDIEVVSSEFFLNYKTLFLNVEKSLNRDKIFSNFAKKNKLNIVNFSQKLLGQIIFCYFLQKKGWFGVDENKKFGSGNKNYLRDQFDLTRKNKKNFFNDFLEYFFYEGLNKQNKNFYLPKLQSKVPYIGGELFEYPEGYDWKDENLQISNSIFSNQNKDGILDIFDLYNFTVDESLPLDIEIAIDPEMLGKVFENLLPENIKKSQGTFYTPREVVSYICKTSLLDYINLRLSKIIPLELTKKFVFDENIIVEKENLIVTNCNFLDKILSDIKICDPSIGSGAFAVSILNLITQLRLKLSPFVKKKYKKNSYYFKRECIQNSIYGVDIDETAVDITKLRLWLSLIVDVNDYEKTDPLPNLDFKILQGDSLNENYANISLGLSIFEKDTQSIDLFSNETTISDYISSLANEQNQYFKTVSYSKKVAIKKNIENIMFDIIKVIKSSNDYQNLTDKLKKENLENLFKTKHKRNFFPWGIFFADVFLRNKGFDIVIGNPPYVDSEEMVKNEKNKRDEYNKIYKSAKGNWDKYIIFIELGLNLLNSNGVISFIVKNTLISSKYSETIRKMIQSYNIKEIRDYSTVEVFKNADVYPVIFRMNKKKEKDSYISVNVMNSLNDYQVENKIESLEFYKDIFWDSYFFETKYTKIISKLLNNKNFGSEDICKISSACTVNESYKIKEIIADKQSVDINNFKFINSGTIDPYKALWGRSKTQYIKKQYLYPSIDINKLMKISNERANLTSSEKIIIANMTKGLECFYDYEAKYCAGKSTTVILKGNRNYSLKFLCAILNSKLINFFILIYFNSLKMSGGAINFGQEQIKKLPFPLNLENIDTISDIVDKILEKINFDTNADISDEAGLIDQLVYQSFDLNYEEIKLVENFKI